MTPHPKTNKQEPGNALERLDDKTLGRIETQLDYVAKAIDRLTEQSSKSEELRVANWLEYRTAHEKLVTECTQTEKRLSSAEDEIVDFMENTKSAIDAAEKDVDLRMEKTREATETRFTTITKLIGTLDTKISPLLFAHKILVWVAIGLGTAVAGLLWGVLTHAISITFR